MGIKCKSFSKNHFTIIIHTRTIRYQYRQDIPDQLSIGLPHSQLNKMASGKNLARHDLPQFYLLVALYFVQGIPVGLAFGTIPFLLKSMSKTMSFTSLGLFSMATYPYSLKILWSPIVDSCYNSRIGRRRSWIIPIQLLSGIMLYVLGHNVSNGTVFPGVDTESATSGESDLLSLTMLFGTLVFLCATQDIAVDGWALTILSRDSLSYASTAQTVGLNIGYFLSFTIFLSLNSADFTNKYLRSNDLPYGLISLGGYLKFTGIIYLIVTGYVMFCVTEHPGRSHYIKGKLYDRGSSLPSSTKEMNSPQYNDDDEEESTKSIKFIYGRFFEVLKLPAVQTLVCIHLVSKIAFQCNEAATNLKLLEKGFKREDLAVSVLIDVPFEIIFGYYVAKWSSDNNSTNEKSDKENENVSSDSIHGSKLRETQFKKMSFLKKVQIILFGNNTGVLTPWLYGFLGRLLAALLGSFVVSMFPKNGIVTKPYFLMIIIQHLMGSFMNTVQFVGISAFHTRVADPLLGGTYMTLLNTVSNFGGTWPRIIIMYLINWFTKYQCSDGSIVRGTPDQCLNDSTNANTNAILINDGYYITNLICVILGIFIYIFVIRPNAQRLQKLPLSSWRCA